jgi:predicted secreted Zn-dependent protease
MRLPSWAISPETASSDREAWDRFACELHRHESLHVDTGRAVAEHVLEALSRIEAPTSEALEARYYAIWRQGLDWGRREDLRIDTFTAHGPLL